MSDWDLNDEGYDVKAGNKIFNGGTAGVVENITAAITKKQEGDHEKAPEYKVVLTDSEDRTIDIGFWYPDENLDEKDKTKYGAKLRHVARCFLGADYKFPKFTSGKDMLDTIMKTLKSVVAKVPVRVLITYGTEGYAKKFPIVRTYPRFIEPMSVSLDDSKLEFSSLDLRERPKADEESGSTSSGSSNDGDAANDPDW